MPLEGKKVSVVIPVYENSDLLEELLEELTNDSYENKEIFVTIDNPNEKSLEVARKYGDKVNFTLNEQRRGKVDALNNAVKISEGEILVFLDSDVKLDSKEFIAVIEREMEGVDILDIKKENCKRLLYTKNGKL
jgi:glycosyltransferase involved in cell wall biosynthesis